MIMHKTTNKENRAENRKKSFGKYKKIQAAIEYFFWKTTNWPSWMSRHPDHLNAISLTPAQPNWESVSETTDTDLVFSLLLIMIMIGGDQSSVSSLSLKSTNT